MSVTAVPVTTSTPSFFNCSVAEADRSSEKRRKNPGPRLDQRDPRAPRIDGAEVRSQNYLGDLGHGARQFHSGGPAAHHHKVHRLGSLGKAGVALGDFKGQQHAAPDLRRILHALQSRSVERPLRMPEVGMGGAGGHDEVVIRQPVAVQLNPVSLQVEGRRAPQQNRDIRTVLEDVADRVGNLARRQRSRGDLVQKWLKSVVVTAVNQRNADPGLGQRARRIQTGEASADDDDVRSIF